MLNFKQNLSLTMKLPLKVAYGLGFLYFFIEILFPELFIVNGIYGAIWAGSVLLTIIIMESIKYYNAKK